MRYTKTPGKSKSNKQKKQVHNITEYDKDMQKQILEELKRQERRRRLIVIAASLVAIACFSYFGVYYFFSIRTNMDYEQLAELKGSDALTVNQSYFLVRSMRNGSVAMPPPIEKRPILKNSYARIR